MENIIEIEDEKEIERNIQNIQCDENFEAVEINQQPKRSYKKIRSKLTKKKGYREKKKLCKPEEVELFQLLLLILSYLNFV